MLKGLCAPTRTLSHTRAVRMNARMEVALGPERSTKHGRWALAGYRVVSGFNESPTAGMHAVTDLGVGLLLSRRGWYGVGASAVYGLNGGSKGLVNEAKMIMGKCVRQ